ncbi:Membrane dipeptidase (Peptidase family M19) [Rubripirellula lacrimiformis]|uniref:Membrane dipeptidase (Peptidase family M19) n=1 Tax=Rubripirellula lacrimiformis TaxID=1930273 RepID=A0A517NJL0_9BACT|nr:membrane dipeptidase [Rubripirellula lacrimiformis]QDT07310.1 Membrane dipeptidase (Peptidase family M19) [Rubripirellula lacrimiformis]
MLSRRQFAHSLGAVSALSLSAVSPGARRAFAQDDNSNGPVQALTSRSNPKIQKSRDTALSILKPSKAELDRGLKLHAESIVFDAYGFGPRASVDGDALAAAVQAGASGAELKDLREEMTMTRFVTDQVEQQEFRDAWRASGVTCVFNNAGEEGQDPLRLIKRLARHTYTTDLMRGFVFKAAAPNDIVTAKRENRHCYYLTGNGVPLTQQWVSVADELQFVRVFYQLGIRMMHLTYQRRNMIGDGCGEKTDAGLSDFGNKAIAEMNRVGVIPDCAHSGWKTSLEAAKASSRPVVASHSTCAGVYRHFRSKPDNVIKAIVDSGGYVGMCCIPRYLGGSGDIQALLDHVDYAIEKFGPDAVAIGTDVSYQSQSSGTQNAKVPKQPKQREEFRMLWPSDNFKTTREMNESIAWTNWPLYTVGLVQRGHSDEVIRKVIGGNVMRVITESM